MINYTMGIQSANSFNRYNLGERDERKTRILEKFKRPNKILIIGKTTLWYLGIQSWVVKL